MLSASRFGDSSTCLQCNITGSAVVASGDVQTNSLGALRVADRGLYPWCCEQHAPVQWVARVGAATVLINQEPAVAFSNGTLHHGGAGAMVTGSANVFVGGAMISSEELARSDALAMIDKALRSVDRWNEEDRRRFREWFGTDSEEARRAMRERLLKMREKLAKEELAVGSRRDLYGHVYPFSNTVNLDDHFWTAPRSGENSRAGVILHETSHFWDAASTDDHAYGRPKCRELARTDPKKAQENADNYEYWMETLP